MRHRCVLCLACAAGALGATCAADAWQIQIRWVQRIGDTDTVLENNVLTASPDEPVRVRLQIGVFADANGPAPLGGCLGWTTGTLSDSDPAGYNLRTPGRLTPFDSLHFPNSNGTPIADPWDSLTGIDGGLISQTFPWAGIPGTNQPAPQPQAHVYGRNEFQSVFELTTLPGNVSSYNITAGGTFYVSNPWLIIFPPVAPSPGGDGIFGPGDFNGDGVDDGLDDTIGSVVWTPAPPNPAYHIMQSVLTVVVPAPGAAMVMALGLLGARRRGRNGPSAR